MKKVTLATLKSFVKKNSNNLFINVKSSFSGYTDCVESVNGGFSKAEIKESVNYKYTLGIDGAWLVGSSRDYMTQYENENFVGIEVYNCCGKFIIAIAK
jgi:hypothetical protein